MKKETIFLLAGTIMILLIAGASAAKNETNRILINEFVTDSQTDWDASGQTSSSDEWYELHNPEAGSIIVDNWYLKLIDSPIETQNLPGTIPAGGFLAVINPAGIVPIKFCVSIDESISLRYQLSTMIEPASGL